MEVRVLQNAQNERGGLGHELLHICAATRAVAIFGLFKFTARTCHEVHTSKKVTFPGKSVLLILYA